MFEQCPGLKAMFGNRDMAAQYRMLDSAVQVLLNFPGVPVIEPTVLSATAASHRKLDLEPRHYDLFCSALLETLQKAGVTEQSLNAWRCTIAPGLEYMKTRSATPAPRSTGTLSVRAAGPGEGARSVADAAAGGPLLVH